MTDSDENREMINEKEITENENEVKTTSASEATSEGSAKASSKKVDKADAEVSKKEDKAGSAAPAKKKKKKSAYRRMIEHRIKVAAIVVAAIATVLILFVTCIASYDFSEKAWHVKFDPFHGYSYTYYLKKDFVPAHIEIDSCTKGGSSVTIPDTIWGARVEVISDDAFKDSVKQVTLGKFVYCVGEGNGEQNFILPENYGSTEYYVTFKDKEASGFYYKANPDKTLTAYAYFKTREEFAVPNQFGGLTVAYSTDYYENTEYLTNMAETLVTSHSMLPYNMARIIEVGELGINPYFFSISDEETSSRLQNVFNNLPRIYKYDENGNPADAESAIKLAITNHGGGKGESVMEVIESYSPVAFIAAEKDLTVQTIDALLNDSIDFSSWLRSGFIKICN